MRKDKSWKHHGAGSRKDHFQNSRKSLKGRAKGLSGENEEEEKKRGIGNNIQSEKIKACIRKARLQHHNYVPFSN